MTWCDRPKPLGRERIASLSELVVAAQQTLKAESLAATGDVSALLRFLAGELGEAGKDPRRVMDLALAVSLTADALHRTAREVLAREDRP